MKKIFMYNFGPRLHSFHQLMLENPPRGYSFFIPKASLKSSLISSIYNINLLKFIYRKFFKSIANLLPISNFAYSSPDYLDFSLTLSLGRTINSERSWILEILDNPYSLAGYKLHLFISHLNQIKNSLIKDNCRKIIVVNESSFNLMRKYFPEKIIQKCVLLRAGVKIPKLSKKISNRINILFVGSLANPDDFYIKGGLEAIESFINIKNENARLILKCKVPREVRKRFNLMKNIQFMEEIITPEKMETLWKNSDILISPSHHYTLMSTLEAMGHGIPIIALDTWGVRDYLNEKYSILIKPSKKIKGYSSKDYPLNIRNKEFISDIKNTDPVVINNLTSALELLIKDKKLRKKLGMNARKEVLKKFNLDKRNKKLKKFFDESLR